MAGITIAIAGATGELGRVVLSALEDTGLEPGQVRALATGDSAEDTLMFRNRPVLVEDIEGFDFAMANVLVMCLPAAVAARVAPRARAAGCRVIDHSSAFRTALEVPLCLEGAGLPDDASLVACPSAEAALLAPVLGVIPGIASVQLTLLEPVSVRGRSGVRELAGQTGELLNGRGIEPVVFPAQVAFNALPVVGTSAEEQLMDELERLLGAAFPVALAVVSVPVFYGLTLSAVVQTTTAPDLSRIRHDLAKAGVSLGNSESDQGLVTPVTEAAGQDGVYLTGLESLPAPLVGLRFWLVGDNLRQGAARQSLAILKKWIKDFKY